MTETKVSIGLPVFNGENYIRRALDSLQAQTFTDFEIIICDNASTDGTRDICREYAKHDHRIRYYQNKTNVGAAANFNLTFKHAKGEYFKWAAHDDICAPEFLTRCVDVLDKHKGVVLAYPKANIIDTQEQVIEPYPRKLRTDSTNPVIRFSELLKGHMCFEIFGLIRRDILTKTQLIGGYAHGDGVLLARLALLGRFEEIPEYLFFTRRHQQQSIAMGTNYQPYAVWFNPKLRNRLVLPWWKIQFEFFRSIHRAPLSFAQRYDCYKCVYWNTQAKSNHLKNDIKYHINKLSEHNLLGRLFKKLEKKT